MSKRPQELPHQSDHEHVGRISTPTILFVLATAALMIYELQLVLLPFVLAGVLAYVCAPAIDKISKAAHLPRLLVAIVVFLLIVAVLAGVGLLGVPPLVQEIKRTVTDFQDAVHDLVQNAIGGGKVSLLGEQTDAARLTGTIIGAVRAWVGNIRVLAVIGGSVLISGIGFVLTLVLLFFFMVSGPAIVRGIMWLVPPQQRPLVEDHILSNLNPVLRRYFIGVLGVVAFASIFAYVGLGLVLGIPHALFLALVTGILEAIPMVGPAVAAAIATLVALHHNSGLAAIVEYAIYLAALRLSIDQFFGPIVLGVAGRVHPALVIFCFLAGGALFGIIGVILAMPVALIVRSTLAVLYDEPLRAAQGK
ncbi:MAG: AI-2E family transporter [Bradyrhizobium sp.]|nr:AI-2E family transporter [Bradyrhizobium sp.]